MATRRRVCVECKGDFQYEIGTGKDRHLCSDACRTARRKALTLAKSMCVVPGCKNPRHYRSGLCNSCYYRLRRTGTLERKLCSYKSIGSSGYVILSGSDHTLASKTGRIYEHRAVLYDAIGIGPHPCHWCSTQVNWIKSKCLFGSLVPDHLDGDKTNNDIANLVPACNRCNASRGSFMAWVRKHKDDPVLWAMYQASIRKASA